MLNQVYQKVEEKVIAKENTGDISFKTDCWSGSTESLMRLTAHFIDNNWERLKCS